MADNVPAKYLLANSKQTKQLAIVVTIDGVPYLFSNRPVFAKIRYGATDPRGHQRFHYGDPGIVYGGLFRLDDVKEILSLESSSLTISQKIEPERGKGSVSQLSLSFIDKDEYMTRLISPGVIIPEILGREVNVYLGYAELSYPDDYFRIFRGYVTGVQAMSGTVVMSLSDPNFKRRQSLFYSAKTRLTAGVDSSTTTIPVSASDDFHAHVLGPNGTYDSAIRTFLQVDEEFMEYGPSGIPSSTSFTVTRGANGSTAAAHTSGASVSSFVQIQDHAIDMALKLMLSGWGGPWKTDQTVIALRQFVDPDLGDLPGAILLPEGVDAVKNLGLVVGDYVTVTGATNGANDGTHPITRIEDFLDQSNRVVVISTTFIGEASSPAVLSFRSKYDTYPDTCGLKMLPLDIDIARHEEVKRTFLSQNENSYRFFLGSSTAGKDFIEQDLYLPISSYSVTRNGQASMGVTRPPLPGKRLVFLDKTSVLDPENIRPFRATNARKFFNEVSYTWDYGLDGNPESISTSFDSESYSLIGVLSTLPINARGVRTSLGAALLIQRKIQFFLSRYKRGATQIEITVNWGAANQIEAGDIVAVEDEGFLQITDFASGKRNIGTQLFEVVERTLNIKDGNAKLVLISGLGAEITDRYGTVAPSSMVAAGSTTSAIMIEDSFGALFPEDEQAKWLDYVNLPVLIRSYDWTFAEERTLLGFDPTNPYKMLINPPLSVAPPAGYIVDTPVYPDTGNNRDNQLYKYSHAFFNPSIPVVTGSSQTVFDVASLEAVKILVGARVRVHNSDYSEYSSEVKVSSVVGTTITVDEALTFTPSSAHTVELIGYIDGGGPYRFI